MKKFIGTSGWNYSHWKKNFYPENLSKKDWFKFYSKKFKTVEINYSFYKWPDKKTQKNFHCNEKSFKNSNQKQC